MTSTAAKSRVQADARGVILSLETGALVRVSVLGEGIVRVRMAQEALAPRRSWDVLPAEDEFPVTPFTVAETTKAVAVSAGPLTVSVTVDGCVSFTDAAGRTFAADLAPASWGEAKIPTAKTKTPEGDPLPEGAARVACRVKKALPAEERYYGFGQRSGLLDRRGRALTNWTLDPDFGHSRCHDNLYQAHPFFLAMRPGLAWGCFVHCTWYSTFDMGAGKSDEMEMCVHGGELDYVICYGPTPAEVLEKLTRLTGRPCLPPLWAMAYHQSRWGYRAQDEMLDIAREFRQRNIPLDVIHFDIDYMQDFRVFSWNAERFPAPKQCTADLRKLGVRTVTIVDPGVKFDLHSGYTVAKEGLEKNHFIMNDDGTPYTGTVWPGISLFPDFTRAQARAWWGKQHAFLVKTGVAGIWNDMNEPSILDRAFTRQQPPPLSTPQGEDDERTTHAEVHNLFGLLMARATYEGLQALRPAERPWILTRSGFTGIGRYAAAWMGDNNSWWEHLEMSLPQLMSMGLCGLPHVGVDIGGFFDHCTPELYARWVELGTFYPFMRTHTCAGTERQEPWSFGPRVEEIARRSIALRYRLLPYFYTLAHQAHASGAPLLRPLFYDFPDDPNTAHIADQAMVGPQLLIAPICRPGQTHRMVYLPAGVWYDFASGERHDGAAWITVAAPLEHIPVFVRGGAVLTLGNERASTMEPLKQLTLDIYPAGDSAWTWVDDDGISFAFERGEQASTTVQVREQPHGVTVKLAARTGAYHPHARTLALAIHLAQQHDGLQITRDGAPCGWAWDAEHQAVKLEWADDGLAHEVVVRW